jgi:hypothetical protein
LQSRVEELERLLLLALNEQKDNNSVRSTYTSAMSSVPEAVVDFGEITVSSLESPNISVVAEASVLPEIFPFIPDVFSDNILPSTDTFDNNIVDNDNHDCV